MPKKLTKTPMPARLETSGKICSTSKLLENVGWDGKDDWVNCCCMPNRLCVYILLCFEIRGSAGKEGTVKLLFWKLRKNE